MDKIVVGDRFTISDQTMEEQEMEIMAVMEIDESEYVAVTFVEDLEAEENEDIDVFFMKVDEEGDLDQILTDEEFQKVSATFDEFIDTEDDLEAE